jgi:mannosyltransferase
MILFDPIIYNLQSGGGVSVYFNSILERINKVNEEYFLCNSNEEFSYFLRYFDCPTVHNSGVFHSSYYRLPKNKKLKIVTTVHDFTYERFIKGPALWVHKWQKYRAIRNSDRVICVSHNTAKDLMNYCAIEPEKIRVIHNGVSEAYYPIPNVENVSNEVLFVGARSGYKNFDDAIKTLAKFPDYTLSIVGGGELTQSEKNTLESQIPGRYTWLGRLSDEELNLAYNRAYALLYPSSYEGFGIPIIEAMRAGCPVVAVNASSIPEVAGNAAILTNFSDPELFVEALYNVSKQREQLVTAGLEQAKKFSWDKCFEETLQVYKELM